MYLRFDVGVPAYSLLDWFWETCHPLQTIAPKNTVRSFSACYLLFLYFFCLLLFSFVSALLSSEKINRPRVSAAAWTVRTLLGTPTGITIRGGIICEDNCVGVIPLLQEFNVRRESPLLCGLPHSRWFLTGVSTIPFQELAALSIFKRK